MNSYGLSQKEYIEAMFADELNRLEGVEQDSPGYFDYYTINNIPYIEYPGFNEEQNQFALNMAKEVMIISKRDNHYNEVAITYNLNDPENFVVVKGDKNSVSFFDNKETTDLINKSGPLMVVSFHNHANQSDFSFADICAFCATPQIKLMSIINNRGEISYLEKDKDINLFPILTSVIKQVVSDIFTRKEINKDSTMSELLSSSEKTKIFELFVTSAKTLGVNFYREGGKGINLKHVNIKNSQIHDKELNSLDETIISKEKRLMSEHALSEDMEKTWHNYFSLPKVQRNGIEWNGEKIRPAIFEDKYLAQCNIEGKTPDKHIFEHFWKNCVAIHEYIPKFCSQTKDINSKMER